MHHLAGRRFGRLTVLRVVGTRFRSRLWRCQCDCGQFKDTIGHSLITGKTQSCGCLAKEVCKLRLQELHENNIKPDAALNAVLCTYRSHAKKKHFSFELSKTDFSALLAGNCFYCGGPPSNVSVSQAGNKLIYSGIDRLDSKQGYILSNCVSCCKPCNWMKKNMSLDEFLSRIRQIAKRHP